MSEIKTKGEDENRMNHIPRLIQEEELEKVFKEMILNDDDLKNGFNILNKLENLRNFHVGVLLIIFNNLDNVKLKRLACSALSIFIRKNYNMNNYITNEEKLVKILIAY